MLDWLIAQNTPESRAASHRRYFDYAMLGEGDAQPGPNWVAAWFGRNLRTFQQLVRLADGADDRVLSSMAADTPICWIAMRASRARLLRWKRSRSCPRWRAGRRNAEG